MKLQITLSSPVKFQGVELTSLTMRESTILDELAMSKSAKTPAEVEVHTLASLCEVTPEVIQQLTSRDHKRLITAFKQLNEEQAPESFISPLD